MAIMLALMAEDRLAPEYSADRVASVTVGSAGLDRTLRVLSLQDEVEKSVQGQVANRTSIVDWSIVRRVRSRPPMIDRVRLLNRLPEPGARTVDEAVHARIDEALAPRWMHGHEN
jgi:hypothetical protein